MKAETLGRLDEARIRLDAGEYGYCYECAEEISEKRLLAMPFAVRCKGGEEKCEQAEQRGRRLAQRGGSLLLFSDALSF